MTTVGFEPMTFRFQVNVLTHSTTKKKYVMTGIRSLNLRLMSQRLNPLDHQKKYVTDGIRTLDLLN